MSDPHVLYSTDAHIARLTLNRPEARNAFSDEMIALWQGCLAQAKADPEVHVIVLTGEGDSFCAGGNLREMADGRLRSWDMKRYLWEGVHRIVLAMEDLDKPVIAAINGPAMGAGLDMALMCDLRVCSEKAVLGESYILMGLVAGDGGAWFLPRLIGPARAMELLLTGDPLSPAQALEWGLVNRVVPHEDLLPETLLLASKIASRPPLAVKMMKRAVYQGQASRLRDHLDYISSQMALLSATHDHSEAVRAFLEKRRPVFCGR